MCGIVGPFLSTLVQNLAMSFSVNLISFIDGHTGVLASFIVVYGFEVSVGLPLKTAGQREILALKLGSSILRPLWWWLENREKRNKMPVAV